MDIIYTIVTYVYWLIVLYFAVHMFLKLLGEKRLYMQVAISIALIPFIYRLLHLK
jgi:uncharacterized membrane protein